MKIRIATRKSELAMWQADYVAGHLRALPRVDKVELIPMTTLGDRALHQSLQKIGGKGLFIKELEVAMQALDADIAVHSMKDVPADLPGGFCIAAVLERANPFDALVTVNGRTIDELEQGAIVGSSSLRRQAQLKALRPDLVPQSLRGNVNSRLEKLDSGRFDAIILACAGLERLGLKARITEQIAADRMLPASAQGVIGIECLRDRVDLRRVLADLDHAVTRQTTMAERAVARHLQATCQSPLASFATVSGDTLSLKALVASLDGRKILRSQVTGAVADAESLGQEVAGLLLQQGASALLHEAALV